MTDATTAAPAATADAGANMVKAKFNFKTEKIRDEAGKVVGEGKKLPSVELNLPVPNRTLLVQFLLDPDKYAKELQLLDSAIMEQVYRMARQQINDFREKSPAAEVTDAVLNYAGLSWTAIANLPPSSRGTPVPADEDFKAFFESYLSIMPEITGKDKSKIENHIAIFAQTFKKQRNKPEILMVLRDALAMWAAGAGEAAIDEHTEVYDYLVTRCDKFINTPTEIDLDAI